MTILLNGYQVEQDVTVQEASSTDAAGGQADICTVQFAEGIVLDRWGVETGMTLEIRDGGYSTGQMYIDAIERTAQGAGILRARSLPDSASHTGWNCFEYIRLRDLLKAGADALGLEYGLYGVDGDVQLRRIVRRGQTWPEFLNYVFRREGAALKFDGGRVLAIGYKWAFAQEATRAYLVHDDASGRYACSQRFRCYRLHTGLLEATAKDGAAKGNRCKNQYGEQIYEEAQARRWAAGLLLAENLALEEYRLSVSLDTGLAAMSRIDLQDGGLLRGQWFIQSVTHDFTKQKSALRLQRCVTTIQ